VKPSGIIKLQFRSALSHKIRHRNKKLYAIQSLQLDLSGAAALGDDPQYTAVTVISDGLGGFTEEDFDLSAGEFTFPADINDVEAHILAIDDTTPEWTKDLGVRLKDDDGQTYVVNHFLDDNEIDSDGDGHDTDPDCLGLFWRQRPGRYRHPKPPRRNR
jgi:hypothetical protein